LQGWRSLPSNSVPLLPEPRHRSMAALVALVNVAAEGGSPATRNVSERSFLIGCLLQQMDGETVPQCVGRYRFGQMCS
jgi:hypothetical protein